MRSRCRATSLRNSARKIHALAFVTPAPVVLSRRTPGVEDHLVIATACVIVGSACLADALCWVTGKVQSLALVAPAPIALSRCLRPIVGQIVVSASSVIMGTTGRTHALTRASCEVHS